MRRIKCLALSVKRKPTELFTAREKGAKGSSKKKKKLQLSLVSTGQKWGSHSKKNPDAAPSSTAPSAPSTKHVQPNPHRPFLSPARPPARNAASPPHVSESIPIRRPTRALRPRKAGLSYGLRRPALPPCIRSRSTLTDRSAPPEDPATPPHVDGGYA